MPFSFTTVCDLLQDLDNNHKRKRQTRGTAQITKDWFAEHRDLLHGQDVDPVALLSTLLPERRTDRVFNIKEKSLERVIATACGLGSRKTQLRCWETEPRLGMDLAECVQRVLAQSPNDVRQEVSVEEIDATLHQLASTVSFSSPAVRASRPPSTPGLGKNEHLLASLFRRLSPRDAKWLCRVILKSFLPVVMPESTVYASFHCLLPTVMKIHDNFAVAVDLLKHHLRAYQARGVVLNKDDLTRIIRPQAGVKVGRQKWLKARGIKHCLGMGQGWMSCEAKMDGEYCQIHVDLSKGPESIQIFSKSGKDSTSDRLKLHPAIISSLRLGTPECNFEKRCILEGELVVYSDLDKRVLGFEKVRKHVNRSGRFIGTGEDSQAHAWERLMIVYYDVLLVDDQSMLNQPQSVRRKRLSSLVQCQEGQAALVESRLINFSSRTATEELREAFASCIKNGEEGLVLKPDEPYFSFGVPRRNYESCCVKLKKGYIKNLGDLGDFAVVGARRDPTAAKVLDLPNVKFTHFYLGCLMNKDLAIRFQAKPVFRVVSEVELNPTMAEYFHRHVFVMDVSPEENDKLVIETPIGTMKGKRMAAVFLEPAVFDITCFDFHQEGDTNFWSPRFPYVSKVHTDRQWQDCVTFDELQSLARADRARVDEDDSQELVAWIKKLEEAEPKQRRKAQSHTTNTTASEASTTQASQGSSTQSPAQESAALARCRFPGTAAVLPPARSSRAAEPGDRSPRKRQRDASPEPARNSRPRKEIVDLTPSLSKASQRSSRQPLGDITSATSSQSNAVAASTPTLSPFETFHEEPKTTKSSPMPAALPTAASFQTAAAFSSPIKAARKTPNHFETPTRSGAQAASAPKCQHAGAICALSGYFILLSPCVTGNLWLTENLLPSHGVVMVFNDIASWNASADLQTSSSAKPRRLVLVERKREEPTRQFLKKLEAAPLKLRDGTVELVRAFDWRLLEAITDVEKAQMRSDGSGTRQVPGTGAFAAEVWRRHFAGVCSGI